MPPDDPKIVTKFDNALAIDEIAFLLWIRMQKPDAESHKQCTIISHVNRHDINAKVF